MRKNTRARVEMESLEPRLLLSNYYISTTGSDSNAGTLAAPLATLAKFFTVAKPGDTAYIRGGTYNGNSTGWGNLDPTVSGTASAPITVTNYNGEAVIIDTNQASANSTDFVELDHGNSYLTFEGLTLSHFRIGFNIQGSAASSHIVLSNMDIGNCGSYPSGSQDGWGVFLGTGTHDVTMTGLVIHNVAGPGMEFSGAVSNVTVQNTQIHDTSGSSGSDGIDVDVSNGLFANNLTFIGDTIWNASDDGFDIKGTNITETNCVAYDITNCCYKCWSPDVTTNQGSFTLTNDIGYNAGETVIRGARAPKLTITNSSFLGTGTGETTFIYDGGMPWGGNLTLSGDKFYYTGTTSYAVAADIQKQNATLNLNNDQYYNSGNANNDFVMRSGTAATTYANAAFNNGSFTSAQGQEKNGQGVLQNIAPYFVTTNIPATATAGTATSFAATANDPEGKSLTYSWTFGDGTAAVTGASVKHTFANSGTYTVIATVSDGTSQTTFSQALKVAGGTGTAPPVAGNDSASTNVNQAVVTPNVLANDSDPNGQALTIKAFTQAAHGTVVNNNNGTFTYTPSSNWTGSDAFTYTISDTSGGTAQATVSITVKPLAPVAGNDSASTNVNQAVVTPNVLANDSDPNGQALTIKAFTQAAHGTVVNNNNGTFTYTPSSNWTGSDAFTYTISDTSGGTAQATVSITVKPLAPVAGNDSASTNVNQAVVTPNVLANDSDPNGQALTIKAFTQAAHGTVVNNNNGTFTYTPSSNWTGSDAFTYTISDTSGGTAQATVSITVKPLAPVAGNDSASTNVNQAVVTPNVLANDSDPNGQALTIKAFTQAAHGTVVNNNNGTFTYTPSSNWIGSDAFTYTISDTSGGTAQATVSITVKPLAPVAGNSYYISTTGSDSNAGTLAAPLATLAKFFTVAKPGDTAYILGGTYNGNSAGWGNLEPTVSGTAAAPITVTNYNGQTVIIDTNQASANSTDFVKLDHGNSYLTFEGLTLSHFRIGFNIQGSVASSHIVLSNMDIGYCGSYPSTAQDGWGIFLGTGTHDVTMTGLVIHNVAGPGMEFSGAVSNVTVQNTQIHDTSGGSGSDGIDVDVSNGLFANNVTFLGDTIWNASDDGFDIKGTNVTLTNCLAYGVTSCDYKLWSPDATTNQGSFTLTNDIGYNAGETVIRGARAPKLTITNSSFLNTGTGETTFIYDGGMPWGGNLTLSGDKFYYTGTTSYAVAADIQKQNATLNLNNDQYYNSGNANNDFVMRSGTAATTYANAAFNNGSFTSAQGQEKNGQGIRQNIAPYLVTTKIPATATAGTAASFSASSVDPEGSPLTYSWTFGDGTAAVTGASVTHTFASGGTYTVIATVSDGTSQATFSQAVTVAGDPGTMVTAAPLVAGDANGDGVVDVVDLGILAKNYGTATGATWAMGDFNGDGAVDVLDMAMLAKNYN